MILNLNGLTITDDGETNAPQQLSVGDGQHILMPDGIAQFANGQCGVTADGEFRFKDDLIIVTNDGRRLRLKTEPE